MNTKQIRRIVYVLFMASEFILLIGFAVHIFRDLYLLATGTVISIPGELSALTLGMYYPSAFNMLETGWSPEFPVILFALTAYFLVMLIIFLVSIRVHEQKVGIYIVISRLFLLISGGVFIYIQTVADFGFSLLVAPTLFIIGFLFFAATILNTIRLHRMMSS